LIRRIEETPNITLRRRHQIVALEGAEHLDHVIDRETLVAAGWPLSRAPLLFETSQPRVFAVGDLRSTSVKRVASAVGEGSVCIQLVHRALAE
jgi:thioredoxin reductase (NADPH)